MKASVSMHSIKQSQGLGPFDQIQRRAHFLDTSCSFNYDSRLNKTEVGFYTSKSYVIQSGK